MPCGEAHAACAEGVLQLTASKELRLSVCQSSGLCAANNHTTTLEGELS